MKFTPDQRIAINGLLTGLFLGLTTSFSILVLLSKYKLILIVW